MEAGDVAGQSARRPLSTGCGKPASSLKILVVAEPACSDSVQSVPHIANLAELAGVPLRIVAKARRRPGVCHAQGT